MWGKFSCAFGCRFFLCFMARVRCFLLFACLWVLIFPFFYKGWFVVLLMVSVWESCQRGEGSNCLILLFLAVSHFLSGTAFSGRRKYGM